MKVAFTLLSIVFLLASPLASGIRIFKQLPQADFDSLNLGLNFELLELDLFNRGIQQFKPKDFDVIGLNGTSVIELITFMRDQEVGHAKLLQEILGPRAAKACNYTFPYTNATSYLAFNQIVTAVGEGGYLGFTNQLANRTNILKSTQIFTTEARQNGVFRLGQGLNPLSVSAEYFDQALTQAQAYTLNKPYIAACPPTNPPIPYTVFPSLVVLAVNPLQKTVSLQFDASNQKGLYAAWISSLNIYYEEITNPLQVPIPPQANGTAFVIVTKDTQKDPTGNLVNDASIVAGPQPVVIDAIAPLTKPGPNY